MPGSNPDPKSFPKSVKSYLTKAVSKVQEVDKFVLRPYYPWPVSCKVAINSKKSSGQITFGLVEMTGCCMYLVSTDTQIVGCYRGKGLSYVLQNAKEDLARHWGYTKLFCTVTMNNKRELRVLEKTGWKQIDKDLNLRTENTVGMFIKEVRMV